MKSVRPLLILTCVFVLLSCGNSGPAVLSLNGTANVPAENSSAVGVQDSKMMAPNIEYRVMNDLAEMSASEPMYNMKRPKDFLGQFAAIGTALGQKGEVVHSAEDSNRYHIGTVDTWGMVLYSTTSESTWSYSNSAASPGSSISSEPCPENCDKQTIEKPKNLLSKDAAQARVKSIFSNAKIDTSTLRFTATADEWSTSVTAVRQLASYDTSLIFSFYFGGDGELNNASGSIISLVKGDQYPLVSPKKAVERLTTSMFAPETKVGIASAVDSGVEIAPTVVPITDVRLSYMSATLANGNSVLIPAFTYSNKDGDVGTVFAVEQKYLATQIVPTIDEGVLEPGQSGSGSGPSASIASSDGVVAPGVVAPIPQSDANTLIGLTEDEASKIAIEKGWLVRVAMRDGEAYMLTMDQVNNRVNLTLVKTLVIAVTVG